MSTVQERREWESKPAETQAEALRRYQEVSSLITKSDERLLDGIMYKWEDENHCSSLFATWLAEQKESSITERLEIVESVPRCEERWYRFTETRASCEQADFAAWTHWKIARLAKQWRETQAKP